jgi:hypothetical protein
MAFTVYLETVYLRKQPLTCCNGRSVKVPLDLHGRISNWADLCLKVDLLSFVDGKIAQRRHDGRGAELLHAHLLLLDSALLLHVLQVDHFRFLLGPGDRKTRSVSSKKKHGQIHFLLSHSMISALDVRFGCAFYRLSQ